MLSIDSSLAEFVGSAEGFLLREDVLCWHVWYRTHQFYQDHPTKIDDAAPGVLVPMLDKLFGMFAEFRSLVDYRLRAVAGVRAPEPEAFPRACELHINCVAIGPRFRIQHGQNTYVFAREIGADFYVLHNVTIGANKGGTPRIGDRVTVRTGAVVVGPIEIGDDAVINANAVVAKNMPAGHAAFAPRTMIRPRKGF